MFIERTWERAWMLRWASSTSHWMTTWLRRSGADWTKALRKATLSTRKASEASAHSPFLADASSVSTRDTDELMMPHSSFRRTGSPMFNRSVVSASDVPLWPPVIWHSAVNNCHQILTRENQFFSFFIYKSILLYYL